ncbi:copper chaperone PCu(A)C [Arthrobacter koreensis]|uniref:copper chaperone PCu(A)C n=1 Tax=Arthrobacter koreensis TaxID=199136 RepID=UPI002DC0177F|nr:copper chaperone PCu(A)C [Arthrobacter koreensis]MEB7446503.1 copper chaperone PCu(A)C [Arthrobacter koreensis]
MKKFTLAAAVLAVSAAVLTGCGSSNPAAETAPAPDDAAALSMTGAWAKAAEADGMTGAFGTLENSGDEDLTIVAASSPAASTVELHEVAMDDDGAMVMREIEGGFVVPAGSDYLLEPGASHLMLMGLTDGLLAGGTVTITLELADGSTLDVDAVAKDFAGGNESYGSGEGHDAESHGAGSHGTETHGTETHGTETHGTETPGTADH